MTATNYFKICGHDIHQLVFFNDTHLAPIAHAHEKALAIREEAFERFGLNLLGNEPITITVWRKIGIPGPWSGHRLVGELMMPQEEFDALKKSRS